MPGYYESCAFEFLLLNFDFPMEIFVFKTNICEHQQQHADMSLSRLGGIHSWSFDFEDVDRVLVVKNVSATPRVIEQALAADGYACEELE